LNLENELVKIQRDKDLIDKTKNCTRTVDEEETYQEKVSYNITQC